MRVTVETRQVQPSTPVMCHCLSETTPDSLSAIEKGKAKSHRATRQEKTVQAESITYSHTRTPERTALLQGCLTWLMCGPHRISEQGSWMPKITANKYLLQNLSMFSYEQMIVVNFSLARRKRALMTQQRWLIEREAAPQDLCQALQIKSAWCLTLQSQLCSMVSSFCTFIFKQTHISWPRTHNACERLWHSIKLNDTFCLQRTALGPMAHLQYSVITRNWVEKLA